MYALKALVVIAIDIFLALCTETPMSTPQPVPQEHLTLEIGFFLAHADQHDGPADKCSTCVSYRDEIRKSNENLVESIAED